MRKQLGDYLLLSIMDLRVEESRFADFFSGGAVVVGVSSSRVSRQVLGFQSKESRSLISRRSRQDRGCWSAFADLVFWRFWRRSKILADRGHSFLRKQPGKREIDHGPAAARIQEEAGPFVQPPADTLPRQVGCDRSCHHHHHHSPQRRRRRPPKSSRRLRRPGAQLAR